MPYIESPFLIPKGVIRSNSPPSKSIGYTRRPGYKLPKTSYTVHSTANLRSSARDERNWLMNINNARPASWNVCVDQNEVVIAIPIDETAYGTMSGTDNNRSIQIEICESGNTEKAILNTIEWIARDMVRRDWFVAYKVIHQHADVQNKNCPGLLRNTNRWDWFITGIQLRVDELKKQREIDREADRLIKYLVTRLGISSPAYWREVVLMSIDVNKAYLITIANEFCGTTYTNVFDLVNVLYVKKVITSKAYWLEALVNKIPINRNYVKAIISNMAREDGM